jgi:Asp-tRNA(Asn)/Glu-tRNA(Gln) amidotransferase A subunit family amidase
VVPVSADLDVVGPIARSVQDVELMLAGMGRKHTRQEPHRRPMTIGVPDNIAETTLAPQAE